MHVLSCALAAMLLLLNSARLALAEDLRWPPGLRGSRNGVLRLTGEKLLEVPPKVSAAVKAGTAAPFTVASIPPTVEIQLHEQLGPGAAARRLWSSWGDICVASDGQVFCAIGDHGQDRDGDARCFIYAWNPQSRRLKQVVDMNRVVPPRQGQPAWSKVHAKLDEGADGRIYFSCTLNDGNRARDPKYGFHDELPGGQLYAFDPRTNETTVVASLPPRRCTATSLLDRERNLWWCNLEAGEGNALFGIDLASRKVVYQGPDGQVASNRAFALLQDGRILFNGKAGLCLLDPASGTVTETASQLRNSPGMRAASRESKQGHIFGVTHISNQLFRYTPRNDELKLLGTNWLSGEYTTVCELSPDERFLYFLPGAHGKAWQYGTPVIQYDIASGTRKVLAFLAPAIEQAGDYVPAGTYGMKLSPDGGTLFVNFNGHPADSLRPAKMKPNGFGLTAFAVIEIPPEER